jgi:hypothetical protein
MWQVVWEALWRFGQAFGRAIFEKPIEFFGLSAAIVSVIFLEWQLIDLRDTLESQAYSYIDNNQIELDKAFIDNSEYRDYFYRNLPAPKGNDEKSIKDAKKIAALADLNLDVIDAFHSQADHIRWTSHYTREAWEEYYRKSFSRSSVLCKQICDYWKEYGKTIRGQAVKSDACGTRIKLADPKNIDSECTWVGDAPKP